MRASVYLWIVVALVAIFSIFLIGRAFDNYAQQVLPSCSQGVCVAPADQTP